MTHTTTERQLRDLLAQGMTLNEIATHTGIRLSSLRTTAAVLGLAPVKGYRLNYTMTRGTIAFEAAEHLRPLGPGGQMPTCELAKLLDIEPGGLASRLQTPRANGAIVGTRAQRGMLWSLG